MRFKKSVLVPLFLVLSFCCSAQNDSCSVLFIGNSLTYYNDMPAMLQRMLDTDKGKKYIVYSATMPAITLREHLALLQSNSIREILNKKDFVLSTDTFHKRKFDYVILQEATSRMLIPEIRKYSFDCMEQLDSLIKNNKGQTILYQNYPANRYPNTPCLPDPIKFKSDSDAFYCGDELLNSTQELAILVKAYAEIGSKIGAKITPIGQAFEMLKTLNPHYNLQADDTHPSQVGSYLMASLFYKTISGKCFKNTDDFTEIPAYQKLDIIEVCEQLMKN
jgi:hypothetical protein